MTLGRLRSDAEQIRGFEGNERERDQSHEPCSRCDGCFLSSNLRTETVLGSSSSSSSSVSLFRPAARSFLHQVVAALRRASSREAARKRRRVEADMFADLSLLLPLQPSLRETLDKPSVIRLTLSYLRTHALFSGTSPPPPSPLRWRLTCVTFDPTQALRQPGGQDLWRRRTACS